MITSIPIPCKFPFERARMAGEQARFRKDLNEGRLA